MTFRWQDTHLILRPVLSMHLHACMNRRLMLAPSLQVQPLASAATGAHFFHRLVMMSSQKSLARSGQSDLFSGSDSVQYSTIRSTRTVSKTESNTIVRYLAHDLQSIVKGRTQPVASIFNVQVAYDA